MSTGWLAIPGWGEPVRAFIGWQEIGAIFVVVLIIFGPKSIPEVARMLAKFMNQFREAAAELQRNLYIDDVKEIQREMRDSWKTKPERMRTVKPGAEHDTPGENLEPDTAAEEAYEQASKEPDAETDTSGEAKEETPPEEEEERKTS